MAESTELCLHVGYGKTGSTYLQAWIASKASQLAAINIHYPIPEAGLGDSGNGNLLLQALANPARQFAWLTKPTNGAILLSREHLARELSANGACEQLAAWAQRWRLGPVRVLLLVRDPQEHCYSLWAQKVKRAGETRTLQDFAGAYDGIRMATVFVQSAKAAGFRVCVRDYGQWRHNLRLLLLAWLGLNEHQQAGLIKDLDYFSGLRLNPTPSYQQLRLVRRLNHWWHPHLGGSAPLPPPWLAAWVPQAAPLRFSGQLVERWNAEVEAFNAVVAATGTAQEMMPHHRESDLRKPPI